MRHHGVEQLRVRQARVIKAQLVKRRAFLTQDRARRYAHALDQRGQQGASGRGFQVLDHMRFNPCMADHGKRVARRAQAGLWSAKIRLPSRGLRGAKAILSSTVTDVLGFCGQGQVGCRSRPGRAGSLIGSSIAGGSVTE
jgi:hypothetical protein